MNKLNKSLSGISDSISWAIPRSTLETLAIFSVLVVGGALRYWNTTIGLPTLYEHDEIFEVHRALELLRGEYNFSRTKGMYYYLLSFMSGIYGVLLILQGYFSDFRSFISYSLVHPGNIILLSRLLCATLGTFSIFLIYRLGKLIFGTNSPSPLLLAIAWATCGLATWIAKWGLIETTVMVFGLLAFFPILNLAKNSSRSIYILAGLLIAAATATKVYGVLLFLPLVCAHVIAHEGNTLGKIGRTLFHGKVILAFFVFGVSLQILNPTFLVTWIESGGGSGIIPTFSVDRNEIYPLPFYLNHLRWNLGNLGFIFFLVGAVTAIKRFDQKVCICTIFAASFFLALGLKKEAVLIYERYLLISLPFFFIVAVYGFEVTWRWGQDLFSLPRMKQVFGRTAVILVGFSFVWNGGTMLVQYPGKWEPFIPVHQVALEWFEKHVPPGSTVVIRGETRPWPGNQNLPIFDLEENYVRQYEAKKQIGKNLAETQYLLDLAKAGDLVRYNLVNETRYVIWKDPEEYIKENMAEYFVVDVEHFSSQFTSTRSLQATLSRREFYQLLRDSGEATLVKTFQGYTVTGGPRTIEVYKVNESHVVLAAK